MEVVQSGETLCIRVLGTQNRQASFEVRQQSSGSKRQESYKRIAYSTLAVDGMSMNMCGRKSATVREKQVEQWQGWETNVGRYSGDAP